LVVYPKVIERHLAEELPFMTTEEIIMAMVEAGADRQEVHERIRVLSQEAGRLVKEEGASNQLLDMIASDAFFTPIKSRLGDLLDAHRFIGLSSEQTASFLEKEVFNALTLYPGAKEGTSELKV